MINYFLKIVQSTANVETYCSAGQTTDDSTMRHTCLALSTTWPQTHTQNM